MKVSQLSIEALATSTFLVVAASLIGSSAAVEIVKHPEKDGYLPIVVCNENIVVVEDSCQNDENLS